MTDRNSVFHYRKKPIVITAHQWFKNGDHPKDGPFTPGLEGDLVRYFRHPDGFNANTVCDKCAKVLHVHGFIDTLEGGHRVCPGDWIITGIQGEHYPCKPDIFEATYEAVE